MLNQQIDIATSACIIASGAKEVHRSLIATIVVYDRKN